MSEDRLHVVFGTGQVGSGSWLIPPRLVPKPGPRPKVLNA